MATPTTRDFADTTRQRIATDPAFAKALLIEAVNLLLNDDVPVGLRILSHLQAVVARPASPVPGVAAGARRGLRPNAPMNVVSAALREVSTALGVSLSVRAVRAAPKGSSD